MKPVEEIKLLDKSEIPDAATLLSLEDINQLVNLLEEKDDTLRYHSLLLLQYRSQNFDDVYSFWDVFAEKLSSPNSYQRSIGLILIAENVRWDAQGKYDSHINQFLSSAMMRNRLPFDNASKAWLRLFPIKNI
jgi:hypothetical protein